ncbi:iron ABC transporter substrate-binding protein [Methanosarcina mazei]|jgi:iron complex transport system substrate-binding protein|uniref:Iron ABC transporter substrate-binding protein n=2 Tax=Methanosarcina mazei TaxID=2209 RepID=A0A0F8KHB8_METMZ|nr:iron ABC transporter substrate-binding protein [Methanosarcina mazei]AKB69972.1 ABC transporter, solute-binding protein [Methanosarcina mazei C16]KKG02886.1 iron ABC transporter substrate-binding protein [Methanosarcina mazei]KKG12297.1 iron ABC transporter substrate-binding protein [Methanosarcina mazei]KKG26920.1 iron ABC transporter substrate-binding protein [Methanosarcina mazei]KKG29734.1 iron ABC transporter substrate-binding protein [Methanosarcina mazei]
MRGKIGTILILSLLVLAVASCGCAENKGQQAVPNSSAELQGSGTVQITDMLGRQLTVTEEISSVVATSPPSTILVYMLAPEKLAGWNFKNNFTRPFMDENYSGLPVIGGWFGTQTGNYETIITMHPDIVIEGYTTDGEINEAIERRQESFGSIPVVAIDDSITFVTQSDPTIKYVGKLLGCEDQAEKLIEFRSSILNEINSTVKNIPEDEKVHVYYAEGPKGLMTDPSGSQHSQVIDICGGINVADCQLTPGNGMTQVSIEQVMDWNPEVIITSNPQFYSTVYSDSLWASVDAVQNKRVYLAPQNPFCWIDRPQGPHLIIGTVWTAKMLYPDLFTDMDLPQLTREFYSEFFHYDLTDEELNAILSPAAEA